MSRAELAEAVNAHLWGVTGRQHALDAHAIARYERGAVRWPTAAYRSGLRAVLGARSDIDLGFRPTARRSAGATSRAGLAAIDDDVQVRRRHFLSSAAALAGISASIGTQFTLLFERLDVAHVGRADVDALRRSARLLAAQTQDTGGGSLRRVAHDAFRGVRRMLDLADYSRDVGEALVTVAGEFAVCAGWTAYDVGDQRTARRYFTEAVLLAGQNDDTALVLRALNALTLQSAHLADGGRHSGPSREAWRCAERMADYARSERSPRLHALIAGHQVVASALVGDDRGFRTAVGRAWRETDRLASPTDSEAWLQFVGPDAIATYVARGYRYRNEPAVGIDVFREYVREAEASPWNRANYQAQLAATLADAGDSEVAADVGRAVLRDLEISSINSPRTVALLTPVCGVGTSSVATEHPETPVS